MKLTEENYVGIAEQAIKEHYFLINAAAPKQYHFQ